MQNDLFYSTMTREDLEAYYVETHLWMRGTLPTDADSLNRAGLADRIERLADAYRQRQAVQLA